MSTALAHGYPEFRFISEQQHLTLTSGTLCHGTWHQTRVRADRATDWRPGYLVSATFASVGSDSWHRYTQRPNNIQLHTHIHAPPDTNISLINTFILGNDSVQSGPILTRANRNCNRTLTLPMDVFCCTVQLHTSQHIVTGSTYYMTSRVRTIVQSYYRIGR